MIFAVLGAVIVAAQLGLVFTGADTISRRPLPRRAVIAFSLALVAHLVEEEIGDYVVRGVTL